MWYIGQTWEAWTLVWVLWERERCRYACVRELLILCCSTRGSEDPTKLLIKHLFHKVKHWRLCYEDMLNMCRIANVLKIKFLCHVAEKGSQFHETQSPLRQTKAGGPLSYATSSSIRVWRRWRRFASRASLIVIRTPVTRVWGGECLDVILVFFPVPKIEINTCFGRWVNLVILRTLLLFTEGNSSFKQDGYVQSFITPRDEQRGH